MGRKSIEQEEKELKEQLEKIKKKQRDLQVRKSEQKRKDRTRLRIIAGDSLIKKFESLSNDSDERLKNVLLRIINEGITRESDHIFFRKHIPNLPDFIPPPKKKKTTATSSNTTKPGTETIKMSSAHEPPKETSASVNPERVVTNLNLAPDDSTTP